MSTPPDVRTRVETTYNAAADRFEDPVNSFWDRFGRRTVERLALPTGSRVLDVCCGTGASALIAAEQVGRAGLVIGVDLADALLARARQHAKARGAAVTSWGERTFEPGDSGFGQAVGAVRPDLYRAFIPWDRITTADSVRALFASAGLPGREVGVEEGEHPLARPEDWWTVVLGSGYRGTGDQLTDDQRDRVREASTAYVRASGATARTTNVVYITARQPNE